jgi:transcriptional regulator with XRE-family HTH domain
MFFGLNDTFFLKYSSACSCNTGVAGIKQPLCRLVCDGRALYNQYRQDRKGTVFVRMKKKTENDTHPGATANASGHRERLAKTLREARRQMGLTQEAFADKAGITLTLVGSFEQAKSLPSFGTMHLICKNLGIDANILLGVETRKDEGALDMLKKSVASHVFSIMDALTEEQRQKIFAAVETIARCVADSENGNGKRE